MRYVINEIRPWEWNPLWTLNEINDGLFLLSERQEVNMEDRVEGVLGRLKDVPEVLKRSMEMMVAHSPLHIVHGNERVDMIMHLVDQLPLKLNSDNLTLDEIDRSIILSREALLHYQKWMNQNAVRMPIVKFPFPSFV